MDKIIIEARFHVFVPQGEDKPERKLEYRPGQVLEATDIPDGHNADDWVAKGLVKAA